MAAKAKELSTLVAETNTKRQSAIDLITQAIASYDQANELLEGQPTEYRVDQARAAIAAGKRHIAAARERLG
jgi:hypothetical protein